MRVVINPEVKRYLPYIIDGRGNRGQLFKLSIGHNGCKSVRIVGNSVHVWYTRA